MGSKKGTAVVLTALVLAVLGLSAACAEQAASPPQTAPQTGHAVEPETKRDTSPQAQLASLTPDRVVITTQVADTTVQYGRRSYWSDEDLSTILNHRSGFTSLLMERLHDRIGRRKNPADVGIRFDAESRSSVVTCQVRDVISRRDGEHYGVFSWLLDPLGLDFIDDNFQESTHGLSWQGKVDGIPTTVKVALPTVDHLSYEAWEHPVGHCHAHVWWEPPISQQP